GKRRAGARRGRMDAISTLTSTMLDHPRTARIGLPPARPGGGDHAASPLAERQIFATPARLGRALPIGAERRQAFSEGARHTRGIIDARLRWSAEGAPAQRAVREHRSEHVAPLASNDPEEARREPRGAVPEDHRREGAIELHPDAVPNGEP